jgi:hypothetical protein
MTITIRVLYETWRASVVVSVNDHGPAPPVGTPEITPVAGSSVRPVGSPPLGPEQKVDVHDEKVYGPVPPATVMVLVNASNCVAVNSLGDVRRMS